MLDTSELVEVLAGHANAVDEHANVFEFVEDTIGLTRDAFGLATAMVTTAALTEAPADAAPRTLLLGMIIGQAALRAADKVQVGDLEAMFRAPSFVEPDEPEVEEGGEGDDPAVPLD